MLKLYRRTALTSIFLSQSSQDSDFWFNLSCVGILPDTPRMTMTDSFIYTAVTAQVYPGNYQIVVIKQSKNGDVVWETIYTSPNNIRVNGITPSVDGGFYLTINDYNSYFSIIVKLDANGNIVWQKSILKTSNYISLISLVEDTRGVIRAVGHINTASGYQMFAISYSSDGAYLNNQTFGLSRTDQAYDVIAGANGDIYIAGHAQEASAGDSDAILIKLNSSGGLIWQKRLRSTDSDVGYALAVDSDENIYMIGTTGTSYILVAKYAINGTLLWKKKLLHSKGGCTPSLKVGIDIDNNLCIAAYGVNGKTYPFSIILKINSSGDLISSYDIVSPVGELTASYLFLDNTSFYLSGTTKFGRSGIFNIRLPKVPGEKVHPNIEYAVSSFVISVYDATNISATTAALTIGTETTLNLSTPTQLSTVASLDQIPLLTQSITGDRIIFSNLYLIGLSYDSVGNLYVIGRSNSTPLNSIGSGSYDLFVAKFNSQLNLIWAKLLGGSVVETSYGIKIGTDNSIFISGYTTSQGQGSADALLIKLSSDGNLLWQKLLGKGVVDYGNGIDLDSENNIYMACQSNESGYSAGTDIVIAKHNNSGMLLWQKVLYSSGSEVGVCVAVSGINVFISGHTAGIGQGSYDIVLAKYTNDGQLLWQKIYGTAGGNYVRNMTIDEYGSVYLLTEENLTIQILKINPDNGSIIWQKVYGNSPMPTIRAKNIMYYNGYIYAAGSNRLLKIDINGSLIDCRNFTVENMIDIKNNIMAVGETTTHVRILTMDQIEKSFSITQSPWLSSSLIANNSTLVNGTSILVSATATLSFRDITSSSSVFISSIENVPSGIENILLKA